MRWILIALLLILGCGAPSHNPEPESCYASVLFENNWRWPVAIYDGRTGMQLVWDLNPLDEELVCFKRTDILDGLYLKLRVKGYVNTWFYVEPLYDISEGDWTFTIEPFTRFAYSWNVR